MRRAMMMAAVAAGVLAGGAARASQPLAVIAVVDKVVFAPNDAAPTSMQVWGTFVLEKPGSDREYGMPRYGYFHYTAPEGKAEECRRDWNEVRKSAGTGKVLGWGEVNDPASSGELRKLGDKPGKGDPYPLAYGVMKFHEGSKFGPVRWLQTIPAPVAPADGGEAPAGKVALAVRNVRDKGPDWRYVFTIESGGAVEKSELVEPGKDTTTWTPKIEIKAGQKYTWRVQAVNGKQETKPAAATFTGK